MAVPITLQTNQTAVEAGAPVPLFLTRAVTTGYASDPSPFSVSPDGQRFLIDSLSESASTSPITVVLNWAGRRR